MDPNEYIPIDILERYAMLLGAASAGALAVVPMEKNGRVVFLIGSFLPSLLDPERCDFEPLGAMLPEEKTEGYEPCSVLTLQRHGFQPRKPKEPGNDDSPTAH